MDVFESASTACGLYGGVFDDYADGHRAVLSVFVCRPGTVDFFQYVLKRRNDGDLFAAGYGEKDLFSAGGAAISIYSEPVCKYAAELSCDLCRSYMQRAGDQPACPAVSAVGYAGGVFAGAWRGVCCFSFECVFQGFGAYFGDCVDGLDVSDTGFVPDGYGARRICRTVFAESDDRDRDIVPGDFVPWKAACYAGVGTGLGDGAFGLVCGADDVWQAAEAFCGGVVRMAVDIIIPVYNAYEKLADCLESIEKWTDLQQHRLVLINDNSTDRRVQKKLDSLSNTHVMVIHNSENKGFAANVNIGIAQSATRDVILLNSDTVVTKGWVEKLYVCAYSDAQIATVTPLSNHATLCSVPDFCRKNKLPQGYSLDEYAALIERVSQKQYPRIPTAHGFCMYVKREVITKIGGFDADTFERGYGEENDFCYRAIVAGYCHAMCDDTFIFHSGTESFTDAEKKRYIKAHEKVLEQRYPKLTREVRVHCRNHPNAAVFENIRFWTEFERDREKKTILYLLHSDFRKDADDHTGGTQFHVKDLTQGLRARFRILVVARERSYLRLTLYTKEQEFLFRCYIGPQSAYEQFRSGCLARLYGRILEIFRISCVHIHHTKGMSLEMYDEAASRGIPVIVTIHDYFYICPGMKLIDYKNQLCIGKENPEKCRVCLGAGSGIAQTAPYMELWRKESRRALEMADVILTPTQSAAGIVKAYYPEIEKKLYVVEHGVNLPAVNGRCRKKQKKKSFHVAFLGGINTAKGYQYAKELICSKETGIRWYLFGNFEQPDAVWRKNCHFTDAGNYEREHLPVLMQKYGIDLVCILPICPETYSYTLSEALSCKLPVLATDIGALGERVRQMDCGWLVSQNACTDDIRKILRKLKGKGAEYQKKAAHVKNIHLRTTGEMCADYCRLYEEQMMQKPQGEFQPDYGWMYQKLVFRQGILYLNTASEDLAARLEEAEKQLAEISGSFAYRAGVLAVGVLPFRRQLKAVLRMAYYWIKKRST